MRKRIPCRVVGSIPLSRSSDALCHSSWSNDKQHKIGVVVVETPTTKKCVLEPPANVEVERSGNPVTYTDRLELKKVSIDDSLSAQILDFYV